MNDTASDRGMCRRRLLGSAGLAALGAAFLHDRVSAAGNPIPKVEDRGANIRIAALRGMLVTADPRRDAEGIVPHRGYVLIAGRVDAEFLREAPDPTV
jgi:hypothetical protein